MAMKFTGSKLTLADLKPVLKRAQDEVDRYNAKSGPLVEWGGAQVKAISETCFDALVDLCKFSSTANEEVSEKPQDRKALLALDAFTKTFSEFQQRVEAADPACNPGGTHEMWMALMVLREKVFTPRELRSLESIKRLVEIDRVPSGQICEIYGWIAEDGSYEVHKIDDELSEPGKHSTKDPNWTNPVHRQYSEKIEKAWKERLPITDFLTEEEQQFLNNGKKKRKRSQTEEAPETVDQLILQGVSTSQIVAMKPSVTEDQVNARREELSLETDVPAPHDARFAPPVDPTAALMEQQQIEDDEKSQRERKLAAKAKAQQTKAAITRAKELKAEGKPTEEISATIASEFPGVDIAGLLPA
jgi:hypothetical protein